jgi:hypothetical protein
VQQRAESCCPRVVALDGYQHIVDRRPVSAGLLVATTGASSKSP